MREEGLGQNREGEGKIEKGGGPEWRGKERGRRKEEAEECLLGEQRSAAFPFL